MEGPYIHHCVGIHKDVVAVLYEACKYLDIKPDLYDENEKRFEPIFAVNDVHFILRCMEEEI